MKFLSISILIVAAFAVACGGGDDDAGAAQQPTAGGDEAASAPTATEAASDSPDDEDTAVVTIDGERYEFDMSTVCLSLGGAVGGFGRATNGRDVTVDISIPPADWEAQNASEDIGRSPLSIILRDNVNNLNWEAGGEVIENFMSADPANRLLEPGQSQVDEFVINGSHASGTATFVETATLFTSENPPQPVTGTFEITCS